MPRQENDELGRCHVTQGSMWEACRLGRKAAWLRESYDHECMHDGTVCFLAGWDVEFHVGDDDDPWNVTALKFRI